MAPSATSLNTRHAFMLVLGELNAAGELALAEGEHGFDDFAAAAQRHRFLARVRCGDDGRALRVERLLQRLPD
jgi:hypothetical protein